jgi:hypothetical protein
MTILEQAYQEGVKYACVQAGIIKRAGGLLGNAALELLQTQAKPSLLSKLMQHPNVLRGAGGAALGGGAGALSAGEDDSALLRALIGAGIGGGAGAGAMPAFRGAQGLIGAGRMGRGARSVGGGMAGREVGRGLESLYPGSETSRLLDLAGQATRG